MNNLFTPLKSESLKDQCVRKLEELIVDGHFKAGHRLPPERELAKLLGISRPIVHEALVELSVKGLVEMTPRIGTVVQDFRVNGTIALLTTLMGHGAPQHQEKLILDILHLRHIVEVDAAKMAASRISPEQLHQLEHNLSERLNMTDPSQLAQHDFSFHQLVMVASGNSVYPLMLNSFMNFYHDLAARFYQVKGTSDTVAAYHRELLDALHKGDQNEAGSVMMNIIQHGEDILAIIQEGNNGTGKHGS